MLGYKFEYKNIIELFINLPKIVNELNILVTITNQGGGGGRLAQ